MCFSRDCVDLKCFLNTLQVYILSECFRMWLLRAPTSSKDFEHIRQRNEPRHEISNNVVCASNKASDQSAHTRSLIKAFASRLSIL